MMFNNFENDGYANCTEILFFKARNQVKSQCRRHVHQFGFCVTTKLDRNTYTFKVWEL